MSGPIEKDIETGSESSFMNWPVGIASGTLSPTAGGKKKSVMAVDVRNRGQAVCPYNSVL